MDENKKDDTGKKSTTQSQKPRTRRTRKNAASGTESAKRTNSASQDIDVAQLGSEEKMPTNLEESVAYLKTVGLRKVSNKTFINEVDLQAFLEGKFDNINKTRALGFIQILEREYPVKLQELRKNYLEYYQQHNAHEKSELFIHAKAEEEFIWKRYLPWVLGLLLVGTAIWYFVRGTEENLNVLEQNETVISQDINSDIVKKAEQNLHLLQEKNENEAKMYQPQMQVSSIINTTRAVPFPGAQSNESVPQADVVTSAFSSNPEASDQNTSLQTSKQVLSTVIDKEDDLDLDAMVKQMVQEYDITDENDTTSTLQENNQSDENFIEMIPAKIVESKNDKSKPLALQTKTAPKTKKPSKVTTTNAAKGKKEALRNQSKLYIKPHKKSWVGVIYLDNYEKKQFLIRKLLKLNPNRPQLIVVGQKEFEIFNNGYSYRFRGKGPVRFIYKDGDIMEINNREFQRLSKGVAW